MNCEICFIGARAPILEYHVDEDPLEDQKKTHCVGRPARLGSPIDHGKERHEDRETGDPAEVTECGGHRPGVRAFLCSSSLLAASSVELAGVVHD